MGFPWFIALPDHQQVVGPDPVRTVATCDPFDIYHGNDADAVMEEARAQDCHRDALDAMGCGA